MGWVCVPIQPVNFCLGLGGIIISAGSVSALHVSRSRKHLLWERKKSALGEPWAVGVVLAAPGQGLERTQTASLHTFRGDGRGGLCDFSERKRFGPWSDFLVPFATGRTI